MKFVNENKKLECEYVDNVVNISSSEELGKELLKPITELTSTEWSFIKDESKKSLNDAVQIKVNVKDVGIVFAYFDKETFTKEVKDRLFELLTTLKSIDTSTLDNLKIKIKLLFKHMNDFNPYFAAVDFSSSKENVDEITSSIKNLSYQLIIIKKEESEEAIAESEGKKQNKFAKGMKWFWDNLKDYKTDYLINTLYSLLVAVCLVMSSIYFQAGNVGVGFLFIGFSFLTFLMCSYSVFVFRKRKRKKGIIDHVIFSSFSVIGVALGIVATYFASKAFVKVDEPISYTLPIIIGACGSPFFLIVTQGVGILIQFIVQKIKDKKKKE